MSDPTKCPCGKPGKIMIRGTNYCANCMPEPETSHGPSAEDALMVEGYKRLYGCAGPYGNGGSDGGVC